MVIPTSEEILAAYEAITADGPFDGPSAPTMDLIMLMGTDPLLAATLERTVGLLDTFIEEGSFFGVGREDSKRAFVASCIVKGLNLGVRIGEARATGPRTGPVS